MAEQIGKHIFFTWSDFSLFRKAIFNRSAVFSSAHKSISLVIWTRFHNSNNKQKNTTKNHSTEHFNIGIFINRVPITEDMSIFKWSTFITVFTWEKCYLHFEFIQQCITKLAFFHKLLFNIFSLNKKIYNP